MEQRNGKSGIRRIIIIILVAVMLVSGGMTIHRYMEDQRAKAEYDRLAELARETTAPPETEAPTEEPETEPETEPPAETYRIKGNSVNVRSEPSTSGRILVQLSNGTEVVYVKRYDNDWAVINYDGQEAYVSSKFIEKVEPVASTGGETGGSEAQTDN